MYSIPILRPDETPRERAQRHVNSLAYSGLAELLMAGITLDDIGDRVTCTAYRRQAKIRIVVTLVHYQGPAWEPVRTGEAPRPLTRQQRAILAACSHTVPMTAVEIARKLGKPVTRGRVSTYLHKMLRRLVDQRRLRQTTARGYLLV